MSDIRINRELIDETAVKMKQVKTTRGKIGRNSRYGIIAAACVMVIACATTLFGLPKFTNQPPATGNLAGQEAQPKISHGGGPVGGVCMLLEYDVNGVTFNVDYSSQFTGDVGEKVGNFGNAVFYEMNGKDPAKMLICEINQGKYVATAESNPAK